MHKFSVIKWVSLLLAVLLFMSACTSQVTPEIVPTTEAPLETEPLSATEAPLETEPPSATEAPTAQEIITLVMADRGGPPSFDPMQANNSRVDTPAINMYNALVQVEPGGFEALPELAESWEISVDGLSYTFKLIEGVSFHDGSELKAEDVKYTIDRMLTLKKGVYGVFMRIEGVEVINDYTFVINLKSIFPSFMNALTRLYILNSELVMQNEENGDWGEAWLKDHDAGSGPYILVSYEPEQQFTVEKFPDYFKGWDGPHVDRVVYRAIPEETTRRLSLENVDIDWMIISNVETYDALAEMSGITVYSDDTLNQLYIALNTTDEYLEDVRIRKAISLAYDYSSHVAMRGGMESQAKGAMPENIPCFDATYPVPAQNLEEAKKLMAEAGYPDGGFTLTMAHQGTNPQEVQTFLIMQAGAAELGISVESLALEWPAKRDLFINQETAPSMGTNWDYPGYPDAEEFLFKFGHSDQIGANNWAWWTNPEFDAAVNSAMLEVDPDVRCEYWSEAQGIWMDQVPYLNLVIMNAQSASRDYVKGYIFSPLHTFAPSFYHIYIEGK